MLFHRYLNNFEILRFQKVATLDITKEPLELLELLLKNSINGTIFKWNSGKQSLTLIKTARSTISLCAFPYYSGTTISMNYFLNIASDYSVNWTI